MECIDDRSGRKREGIVRQRITLREITYRMPEIERVGRVGFECVLKEDNEVLPGCLNLRRMLLRRGHKQVLTDVIQLQILAERNVNLLPCKLQCTVLRDRTNGCRRNRVPRATLGSDTSVRTTRANQNYTYDRDYFSHCRQLSSAFLRAGISRCWPMKTSFCIRSPYWSSQSLRS